VAGTPGLEAILDFAKMIDDHNLYEASLMSDVLILRVKAINNEQFLGHDPSREPDAENNVYQSEMIFINNGIILDKNTVEDSRISISYWATTLGLEHTKVHIFIYRYMNTCIHTHAHMSIYIYMYICVSVYLIGLNL
jgi:hypothetical protein